MDDDLYGDLCLSNSAESDIINEGVPKGESTLHDYSGMDLMDEGLTNKFKKESIKSTPLFPKVDIQLEKLKREIKELKKENAVMEQNLVLLYKTAHHILQIKDKELTNLRQKYDAICFRKNGNTPRNYLPSIAPEHDRERTEYESVHCRSKNNSSNKVQTTVIRPELTNEKTQLQNYLPARLRTVKDTDKVTPAENHQSQRLASSGISSRNINSKQNNKFSDGAHSRRGTLKNKISPKKDSRRRKWDESSEDGSNKRLREPDRESKAIGSSRIAESLLIRTRSPRRCKSPPPTRSLAMTANSGWSSRAETVRTMTSSPLKPERTSETYYLTKRKTVTNSPAPNKKEPSTKTSLNSGAHNSSLFRKKAPIESRFLSGNRSVKGAKSSSERHRLERSPSREDRLNRSYAPGRTLILERRRSPLRNAEPTIFSYPQKNDRQSGICSALKKNASYSEKIHGEAINHSPTEFNDTARTHLPPEDRDHDSSKVSPTTKSLSEMQMPLRISQPRYEVSTFKRSLSSSVDTVPVSLKNVKSLEAPTYYRSLMEKSDMGTPMKTKAYMGSKSCDVKEEGELSDSEAPVLSQYPKKSSMFKKTTVRSEDLGQESTECSLDKITETSLPKITANSLKKTNGNSVEKTTESLLEKTTREPSEISSGLNTWDSSCGTKSNLRRSPRKLVRSLRLESIESPHTSRTMNQLTEARFESNSPLDIPLISLGRCQDPRPEKDRSSTLRVTLTSIVYDSPTITSSSKNLGTLEQQAAQQLTGETSSRKSLNDEESLESILSNTSNCSDLFPVAKRRFNLEDKPVTPTLDPSCFALPTSTEREARSSQSFKWQENDCSDPAVPPETPGKNMSFSRTPYVTLKDTEEPCNRILEFD